MRFASYQSCRFSNKASGWLSSGGFVREDILVSLIATVSRTPVRGRQK